MAKTPKLTRGQAFHARTIEAFDLTDAELELLNEAAGLLDELAILKAQLDREGLTVTSPSGVVRAHPCLAEIRNHRVTFARILAQLSLPDDTGETLATATQIRGRQAAAKRWSKAV